MCKASKMPLADIMKAFKDELHGASKWFPNCVFLTGCYADGLVDIPNPDGEKFFEIGLSLEMVKQPSYFSHEPPGVLHLDGAIGYCMMFPWGEQGWEKDNLEWAECLGISLLVNNATGLGAIGIGDSGFSWKEFAEAGGVM